MNPEQQGRLHLLGLVVVVEGGLGVLAVLLGWLLGQPLRLSWDHRDAALGIAVSLPLLAGFFLCVRWPVGPLARIKQFADDFVRPLFAPCSLAELAFVSLLAGFGEEVLFRGVLQGLFGGWLGQAWGIVAASALFGLFHLITPTYALLAAVIGLYLGWISLATGNLLVVVAAHAVYDFVALIHLVRRPSS